MRIRLTSSLSTALFLFASCAALHPSSWRKPDVEDVPAELARAEEERAAGEFAASVERLLRVRAIPDLEASLREQSGDLLERSAEGLLDRHESSGSDPDAFDELFEEEGLSAHLRARAGVLAAEGRLAEGSRVSAVKTIKKVDQVLPGHTVRIAAGALVARTGLSLIRDGGHYGIFFSYRGRGVNALEYLVLQYPLDSNCPAAYAALADHYEEVDDLDLAIERHEDLVLYHPLSPEAVISEARLPFLRLKRLERDDYDRHELLRARAELSRWIERHTGHELEGWVRDVAQGCDRRLTENDLILARYFHRIGSPLGARIHSERALRRAEEAGIADLVAQAKRVLETLPHDEPKEEGFELPVSDFDHPSGKEARP